MSNSITVAKVCVSITILLSSHVFAAPKLSEKIATEKAAAFSQQIQSTQLSETTMALTSTGLLSQGSGATQLKTQLVASDARHEHLRWKITSADQSETLVDDNTGLIVDYRNEGFYYRHDKSPTGPAMPKEKAVQQAIALLKTAGLSASDFTLDDAWERQDGTRTPGEGKSSGHFWMLWFRKNYKGIPYRDQDAFVQLQAETGEVVGAAMEFDLFPPQTVAENVSRDQATSIGKAQLAASGITELPVMWVNKMIIQPDTFWQNGNQRPSSDTTRVAWMCGFGSPESAYGVWVDAQTGDVIGGMMGGTLGGNSVKRQTPIFGHQIKHKNSLSKASNKPLLGKVN